MVRVDSGRYDLLPADQVSGFDDYFVVRTPATARRYRDSVAPGAALVHDTGLGRIFSHWGLRDRPEADGPCRLSALILAGRQDSIVGFAHAGGLVPDYPHATYAVLDGAGHALPHEQPELVASLINDWISHARQAMADSATAASSRSDTPRT